MEIYSFQPKRFEETQAQASNPNISAWVQSNAGTGKTKLLIDRIIRLLLNQPSNNHKTILCITFSINGATEISNRITDTLKLLHNSSNSEAKNLITNITGELGPS